MRPTSSALPKIRVKGAQHYCMCCNLPRLRLASPRSALGLCLCWDSPLAMGDWLNDLRAALGLERIADGRRK